MAALGKALYLETSPKVGAPLGALRGGLALASGSGRAPIYVPKKDIPRMEKAPEKPVPSLIRPAY